MGSCARDLGLIVRGNCVGLILGMGDAWRVLWRVVALGNSGAWHDDLGVHPVGVVGNVIDDTGAFRFVRLRNSWRYLGFARIFPVW